MGLFSSGIKSRGVVFGQGGAKLEVAGDRLPERIVSSGDRDSISVLKLSDESRLRVPRNEVLPGLDDEPVWVVRILGHGIRKRNSLESRRG